MGKYLYPFVDKYSLFLVMLNLLLEFNFFMSGNGCVDPQGPRDWKNLELGFCLG